MFTILSMVIRMPIVAVHDRLRLFSRLDSLAIREISTDFVQFIANHMQDTRIVNTGSLDS